ncbi:MAG: hypothetical protein BSOLF_2477 [Candidatus Carbobacillus altaicus]|uniref:Uncharacterized protein n=1 Tax=Candidatus Carbonibacillus altaicus TaxID=2163959 RepID=A0A2R6Y2K2_9BACL|nr:MAG: hypothetical protein BSOLF_2477 [Candidatus Carbobacillus altaicus]
MFQTVARLSGAPCQGTRYPASDDGSGDGKNGRINPEHLVL